MEKKLKKADPEIARKFVLSQEFFIYQNSGTEAEEEALRKFNGGTLPLLAEGTKKVAPSSNIEKVAPSSRESIKKVAEGGEGQDHLKKTRTINLTHKMKKSKKWTQVRKLKRKSPDEEVSDVGKPLKKKTHKRKKRKRKTKSKMNPNPSASQKIAEE